MQDKDKERLREQEDERKRLLAMSDFEANALSKPEQYQRIRYLREIEAYEFLNRVKQGLVVDEKKEFNRNKVIFKKV